MWPQFADEDGAATSLTLLSSSAHKKEIRLHVEAHNKQYTVIHSINLLNCLCVCVEFGRKHFNDASRNMWNLQKSPAQLSVRAHIRTIQLPEMEKRKHIAWAEAKELKRMCQLAWSSRTRAACYSLTLCSVVWENNQIPSTTSANFSLSFARFRFLTLCQLTPILAHSLCNLYPSPPAPFSAPPALCRRFSIKLLVKITFTHNIIAYPPCTHKEMCARPTFNSVG